jgi:hypothetical protein
VVAAWDQPNNPALPGEIHKSKLISLPFWNMRQFAAPSLRGRLRVHLAVAKRVF